MTSKPTLTILCKDVQCVTVPNSMGTEEVLNQAVVKLLDEFVVTTITIDCIESRSDESDFSVSIHLQRKQEEENVCHLTKLPVKFSRN